MNPAVSVLMPVYNTQRYLAEAVESILHQTFTNLEFIIINDGSTDQSLNMLKAYAKQDSRIRLLTRENQGLVMTRNQLLEEAKCELVAWADSDDTSSPHRLATCLNCFTGSDDLAWVGSAFRLIDPAGWPICIMSEPSTRNNYGVGTAMMRRKTVNAIGGFRHGLKVAEDYDLGLRLERIGRSHYIDQPLVSYRQHLRSVCNSSRLAVNDYINVVKQQAREPHRQRDLAEALAAILPARHRPEPVRKTYARWAWWALGAGNVRTARKYAAKVAVRRPLSVNTWRLAACALRGR